MTTLDKPLLIFYDWAQATYGEWDNVPVDTKDLMYDAFKAGMEEITALRDRLEVW